MPLDNRHGMEYETGFQQPGFNMDGYIKFEPAALIEQLNAAHANLSNLVTRYEASSDRRRKAHLAKVAKKNEKRWFKRKTPFCEPLGAYFLSCQSGITKNDWMTLKTRLTNRTEPIYLTLREWASIHEWAAPGADKRYLARYPDLIVD